MVVKQIGSRCRKASLHFNKYSAYGLDLHLKVPFSYITTKTAVFRIPTSLNHNAAHKRLDFGHRTVSQARLWPLDSSPHCSDDCCHWRLQASLPSSSLHFCPCACGGQDGTCREPGALGSKWPQNAEKPPWQQELEGEGVWMDLGFCEEGCRSSCCATGWLHLLNFPPDNPQASRLHPGNSSGDSL